MFVIRPKGIYGTPHQVALDLGCQTRFYPNPRRQGRQFDYRRDFFMAPVYPEHTVGSPVTYRETHQFATRNKYGQRLLLSTGDIPAPAAATDRTSDIGSGPYVVRPLRHFGGRHYRVTTDRLDVGNGEYISSLYPKRREYRIIFVFGQPLIYLRKKPNEGVENDAPWGHINSSFQTINDVAGSKIGQTDATARLSAFGPVRGAHIVAADILYNSKAPLPWVCLELNFCPALDIDRNRAKVVEAIRARQ